MNRLIVGKNQVKKEQQEQLTNNQSDFSNFELKIICQVCNKVFEKSLSVQDMYIHNQDHNTDFSQIEISLQNCEDDKQSVENDEEIKFHQNRIHSSDKIERQIDKRIIEQVEKALNYNNDVTKGTKKQYRGPMIKFFKWLLDKYQRILPQAPDIIKYINKFKLSVSSLAALQRIRVVFDINFTPEQDFICKKARQTALEAVQENPNRAWDLKLIQQFINDLVENGFELIACRIYALYQIGGKISDLSQITIKMLTTGYVSYIPYNQTKMGEKARREIYIGKEISDRIQDIVKKYNISEDQTLNIGRQKNSISISALQKDLFLAKKALKENVKNKSKEYEEFLEKFNYSDLKLSKIVNKNIEPQQEQIQNKKQNFQKLIKVKISKKQQKKSKIEVETPQHTELKKLIKLQQIYEQENNDIKTQFD